MGSNSSPNRSNGVAIDAVRGRAAARWIPLAAIEDVAEAALDGGHGVGRGVDGNLALLAEVEGTHVVEAHDVVGMRVSEDHRVEAVDTGAQRLRAEIGRGVDQDVVAVVADQNRRPQAIVARIGGGADVAMAADGGHADTGARAEHRDLQWKSHPGYWEPALESCDVESRSLITLILAEFNSDSAKSP